MAAEQLPEKILLQILEKLPTKSLLRFSCVCKSWSTLIKNPSLTEKHLSYVNNNMDDSPVIFLRSRRIDFSQGYDYTSTHMERLILLENESDNPPSIVATRCVRIHGAGNSHDTALEVVNSSCNGILCLAHRACGLTSTCRVSTVCLYNPITQQELTLPPSIFDDKDFITQNLGFGFDKSSNDYKVIRIRITEEQRSRSRSSYIYDNPIFMESFVEIYKLSAKRWSKLNADLRYQDCIWNWGEVLFNGFFHWLHGNETNLSILTFDFHAESFGKIELSGEMDFLLEKGGYSVRDLSMAELDDSLAVFIMDSRTVHIGLKADLWVMKEYGNKSSWTKMLSLDSSITELRSCYRITSFGVHSRSLVLLCRTSNGNRLVSCGTPEDDGEGEGEGGTKFTVRVPKFDKEYDFSGVSFRPTLVSLPRDS